MSERKKQWLVRIVAGGVLGAVLAPLAVYAMAFLAGTGAPQAVTGAMVQAVGSRWLAALLQCVLGGVLGAVVLVSTLPFADQGRELVVRSVAHFAVTAAAFALLLWVCRWVSRPVDVAVWVSLLAVLYLLIWLGRWIGWYVEVTQLRTLLGLAPGPSPLKWRETLPYLPFLLLVCDLLPLVLRAVERAGSPDVPVLTGLILPYILLPTAGFCSGLSLGKRQGVCPLYPVAAAVCYLPTVWLLLNGSALFHCFMVAVPALVGNLLGWLYRRAVPKGEGG